jgi:hypothetical protein
MTPYRREQHPKDECALDQVVDQYAKGEFSLGRHGKKARHYPHYTGRQWPLLRST